MTYNQLRQDFEFLERIYELEDQVELDASREELMQNPTKKTAGRLYLSGIQLWFHAHKDKLSELGDSIYQDKISAIKDRYSVFL